MNILDIILLLCFIPAIINGLRKGFISQVIAIISLVLGTWLSFKFSVTLSHWMSQWIETSPQLLNTIAFAVIFVVVVFVLFAIGKIFEATIKIIMLSWLNKLLGVLFAFLKCAIILGLVILAFNALNTTFSLVPEKTLADSALYYPLKNMAYSVFPYLKGLIMGI